MVWDDSGRKRTLFHRICTIPSWETHLKMCHKPWLPNCPQSFLRPIYQSWTFIRLMLAKKPWSSLSPWFKDHLGLAKQWLVQHWFISWWKSMRRLRVGGKCLFVLQAISLWISWLKKLTRQEWKWWDCVAKQGRVWALVLSFWPCIVRWEVSIFLSTASCRNFISSWTIRVSWVERMRLFSLEWEMRRRGKYLNLPTWFARHAMDRLIEDWKILSSFRFWLMRQPRRLSQSVCYLCWRGLNIWSWWGIIGSWDQWFRAD